MSFRFRRLAMAAALMLLLVALSRTAFAQTKTEKVAQCIDEAAEAYVDCTEKGGWLWDQACLIKYEADAILCVLEILPV